MRVNGEYRQINHGFVKGEWWEKESTFGKKTFNPNIDGIRRVGTKCVRTANNVVTADNVITGQY